MVPSTYLCDQGFLALFAMNKFHARLYVKAGLHVCLSKSVPQLEDLFTSKKAYTSH